MGLQNEMKIKRQDHRTTQQRSFYSQQTTLNEEERQLFENMFVRRCPEIGMIFLVESTKLTSFCFAIIVIHK